MPSQTTQRTHSFKSPLRQLYHHMQQIIQRPVELLPYDELTYDLGLLMNEGFIVLAVNNIPERHVEKNNNECKKAIGPSQ